MGKVHLVLSANESGCGHVEFLQYIVAADRDREARVARVDSGGVDVEVWVLPEDVGGHLVNGRAVTKLGPKGAVAIVPLAGGKVGHCVWARNASAGRTARIEVDVLGAG